MDTKIRNMLQAANQHGANKGLPVLQQAYELMRNVAETRPAVDAPEAFSQDLLVICAETAYQYKKAETARECLKLYFMKTPPSNQFLCRAYLCQAQLLAPSDAENPEQLEQAVVYLIKAINMAKENQRYHFLVYNASVLYWQFCRPFLKPGYRQYLAQSLHEVVKVLDDIDDKDYEWRAQLLIALIECHMDAGHRSDASNVATAAVSFIKQNVPALYKTVFGLMVRHQLTDSAKFQKDIKSSLELKIFYNICLIKQAIEELGEDKDFTEEISNVLQMIQGQKEEGATGKSSVNITPDERVKSPTKSKALLVKKSKTDAGSDMPDMPYLMLELGRLALERNLPDIAQQCVNSIQENLYLVTNGGFFLEVEFLKCELIVKSLGDQQESYSKSSVHMRLQAIKRCEEAIQNAIRQKNPNVIQAGCVTQWNLCLPLLQPNLRHHVRRPLTVIADALEAINSLLIQLRCQVHMELGKCEEDQEQISVAMTHLKKALLLDDGKVYEEKIQVALHRMELRSELYNHPDKAEDQAGMIIEQARKADSGTIRMKRSLLVRAGQALAPDAFSLVLESESETKEVTGGKGPLTQITRLAGKARQFNKCVKKATGHLRRLGDENDRERARLWADLAKTARKQEVWDVCRAAARFCLLYDDDRWKNEPSKIAAKEDAAKKENKDSEPKKETSKLVSSVSKEQSRPSSPEPQVPLSDKDLVRTMAEIHFINGEAFIHLLRSEGIELYDKPVPPEDRSKRPNGYVAIKPDDDPEWQEYSMWIASLSSEAVASFLRSMSLGVQLQEAWICCCAATYIWNYSNHIIQAERQHEIVDKLAAILQSLRTVGHAGETSLLVSICNSLATGLIQPWLLPLEPRDTVSPTTGPKSPTRGASPKRKGAPAPTAASGAKKSVTISADAIPDLKKALEVCEYGLQVTNGSNPADVVPISVRYPLLQTWVRIKQMLQSNIGKGLGTDDESKTEGQHMMTRAIVAVEMLSLHNNGIMEFKDLPSLSQIVTLVEASKWTDFLVELQLWARLTFLSYEVRDHAMVQKCAVKALDFAFAGTQPKGKKSKGYRYTVEQEMLSYASCLYGQSLMDISQGKNSIRRQAMEAFLHSARYGSNANNGGLVMAAARHYWNAALPLISIPLERELLMEPLPILLQCIAETSSKAHAKKYQEKEESEETEKQASLAVVSSDSKEVGQGQEVKGSDDDLSLRAAIYGVLFQAYADKGEWEASLKAMDQAIADMPRTSHRLQIFKHMVLVRAKLGLNVNMSVQKFKDGNEDYVAHMWRRVALCSKEQTEQLQAYQNAIEALTNEGSDWQKFDYLLEFGQWLFVNEFPLQDVLDQMDWACDILLNFKFTVKEEKQDIPPNDTDAPEDSAKDKKAVKTGKEAAQSAKSAKKSAAAVEASKDSMEEGKREGDKESEVDAAQYVPVKKDVTIGVLAANPGQRVSDLGDVKQLEGLFRACTLQAQVSGRASERHVGYCLLAYGYVMRIWQISLGSCGPAVKEIAKNPPQDHNISKSSAKGKKKDAAKDAVPPKDKVKRKGPLDAVPSSTEEWASYDAPDEVIDAFRHEMMKTTGVNSSTFTKPALTMHYLQVLVKLLQELGYNHLTLPLLALQDVLSRSLMKNRLLAALIHLRAMEVCLELNLGSGALFHENLADFAINPEDQTRSREEITLWKEKQVQVAKEEKRLKESKFSQALSGKHKKMVSRENTDKSAGDKGAGDGTATHLGKTVGAVSLREVWTDMAELFLKHALYQPAREMLTEAHLSAKAFEDKPLLARVLLLFGKLAFHEAQYGQAFNFATLAQKTHEGDEMFWYETTMLIVNATQKNYQIAERREQAQLVVENALNAFREVAQRRPNKVSITGYILAMLEAKLKLLEIEIANDKVDVSKAKKVAIIMTACKDIRHSEEKLVQLGYTREAVQLYKERIRIFNTLAREAATAYEKQYFYLECMKLFKEVQVLADKVLYDIQTSSSVSELQQLSLPVQRESAEIKLMGAELMLEILKLMTHENHMKHLAELRKGSLLQAVEELAQEAREYSPAEKEWKDAKDILGDVILTLLSNVHCSVTALPQLKARCLYNIGHCLSLLSDCQNPDRPSQWNLLQMNVLRATPWVVGGSPEEQDDHDTMGVQANITVGQENRYRLTINRNMRQLERSFQYLTQATECLTQALNLALSRGHAKLAGLAALELVECMGQYDPGLASQYLALHQSCEAAVYLEHLMTSALVDPNKSQQAALIHQKKNLLKNDITSNASRGPVLRHVEASLQQLSQAWKRLVVSPNHLDILKDFPPQFHFVLVQHSPDRNYWYGAVLDRPRTAAAQSTSKTTKGHVLQASSKAKVIRTETNGKVLDALLERCRSFKQDMAQKALTDEYRRNQQAMRSRMLAKLAQSDEVAMDAEMDSLAQEEEHRLQHEFQQIISEMEDYLRPLSQILEGGFRPSSATTVSNEKKGEPHVTQPPQEYVVLLVDRWLQQLPLEALGVLQNEAIVSLSREISLQMLHHKWNTEVLDDAADKAKKEKEKTKPPSRIPGMRDTSKKQSKIIPLDRAVPQGFVPVETHAFKYIVDPYLDCSETEVTKPTEVFEAMLEEHSMQFTPRWLGVSGKDHTPSPGEYEIYLQESSAFVFYGMERLLCYLPPYKVASMNLLECQMVMLFDHMQTNKSFLRQSKTDVLKPVEVIGLEQSVETAMLLSLTGVRSVITNQWCCPLAENAHRLQLTMKELLAEGRSNGQTVRLLQTPLWRQRVTDEDAAAAAGDVDTPKSPASEQSEEQEDEATQPSLHSSWYNMVCYGLPNLIVTQLAKL